MLFPSSKLIKSFARNSARLRIRVISLLADVTWRSCVLLKRNLVAAENAATDVFATIATIFLRCPAMMRTIPSSTAGRYAQTKYERLCKWRRLNAWYCQHPDVHSTIQ
jgi:hypothetical protein